jgi:hypothetical protein
MTFMVVGILVFLAAGFVAVGLLGGSSLFYGQTIKSDEKIDKVEFTVVERSGASTANVSVYLNVGGDRKKLRTGDTLSVNEKEIPHEYYNGGSVGYRYRGEIGKADQYKLKVKNSDETIERQLHPSKAEPEIPSVLDLRQPFTALRFGKTELSEHAPPSKIYVELAPKNGAIEPVSLKHQYHNGLLKIDLQSVPDGFSDVAILRISQTYDTQDAKYVLTTQRDVNLIGRPSQ